MKDPVRKIRSKGSMVAESRWWVTELLAADCEKAWIHPGWEDTMQKVYEWLEKMNKEDEKKNGGNSSTKYDVFFKRMQREVLDSCTKSRSPRHGEEEHRS